MHNVKRLSAEQRAKKRAENEERAKHYSFLSQAAMARRAAGQLDEQSLEAAALVLALNPDMATLWNFRRQVLMHLHADDEAATDAERSPRRAACEREMELTQQCLMANPKSYPVWFHRMWVLKWGRCSWRWATELKLTAKLLALDERNFHCWTYRRFLVKEASVAWEDEVRFTMAKIQTNFSNYSAWHYRSKLLPQIYAPATAAELAPAVAPAAPATELAAVQPLRAVLLEELELLRNAFFTAPEDQSAWFYHRWVLAQLEALAAPPEAAAASSGSPSTLAVKAQEEVLCGELTMAQELVELEPDCKWPLATVAFIGQALRLDPEALAKQLHTLQRLDPMRHNFYAHRLTRLSAAQS